MPTIAFVVIGGAIFVTLIGFGVLIPYRYRRLPAATVTENVYEPLSNVHLLTTVEQIEEAAHRSAVFERVAAANASERALHFETVANAQHFATHADDVHFLSSKTIIGHRTPSE